MLDKTIKLYQLKDYYDEDIGILEVKNISSILSQEERDDLMKQICKDIYNSDWTDLDNVFDSINEQLQENGMESKKIFLENLYL